MPSSLDTNISACNDYDVMEIEQEMVKTLTKSKLTT